MSYTNNFNFECPYSQSWHNDFDFPYMGCSNTLGLVEITHGASVEFDLRVGVELLLFHGQELRFEFAKESKLFEFSMYHGEDLYPKIQPSHYFGTTMWRGELLNPEVRYYPTIELKLKNLEHGSISYASLNTEPRFAVDEIKTGSTLSAGKLVTPFVLAFNSNRNGSRLDFDLTLTGGNYLEGIDAYHGEIGSATLNNAAPAIRPFVKHGAILEADTLVALKPLPLPGMNIWHDAKLVGEVSASYQLPPKASHGAIVNFEIVVNDDDLWRVRTGHHTKVELYASSSLSVKNIEHGEGTEFNLETRGPPLFELNAVHGSKFEAELTHLYSAALYPYPFVHDQWFDPTITPTTLHFNTCHACDYPIRHWNFIMQLERYPSLLETWSAELKTRTVVDLSIDRNIEVNMYDGFQVGLQMDNVTPVEPAIIWHGSRVEPFWLTTQPRIDTDHTNPEPNPDDLIIEVETEDPKPEQYVSLRGGAYGLLNLSAYRWRNPEFHVGERIEWELTIDDFTFPMYHGQILQPSLATTVRLNPEFDYGASLNATLYDPPIMMYDGSRLDFSMKLVYDVEWTETGCVDNEWVDANGEHKVAIEMEEFRHSLKARCF